MLKWTIVLVVIRMLDVLLCVRIVTVIFDGMLVSGFLTQQASKEIPGGNYSDYESNNIKHPISSISFHYLLGHNEVRYSDENKDAYRNKRDIKSDSSVFLHVRILAYERKQPYEEAKGKKQEADDVQYSSLKSIHGCAPSSSKVNNG